MGFEEQLLGEQNLDHNTANVLEILELFYCEYV